MYYFLYNQQTQQPMSEKKLMTLVLHNTKKAEAWRKEEMESCGYCPSNQPERIRNDL